MKSVTVVEWSEGHPANKILILETISSKKKDLYLKTSKEMEKPHPDDDHANHI